MPTIPKPHMTTLVWVLVIVLVLFVLYHLFFKSKG